MLADAGPVGRRKQGLRVFYLLADLLVERLCRLDCETIAFEPREEVERQKKLLDGWSSKPGPSGPGRRGDERTCKSGTQVTVVSHGDRTQRVPS
jgi:hypothetical protein